MQQLENELAHTQTNLETATKNLEDKEKALQNVSERKDVHADPRLRRCYFEIIQIKPAACLIRSHFDYNLHGFVFPQPKLLFSGQLIMFPLTNTYLSEKNLFQANQLTL